MTSDKPSWPQTPPAASLLAKLTGGDRRSIGRSGEVAEEVLAEPRRFGELIDGMLHDDALVRMRAADAAEKVSARHPDWLTPHKRKLLGDVAAIEQQEVRWHLAQMLPRMSLTPQERRKAVWLLLGYLHDESRIVRTFSMQALADLALQDSSLRRQVVPVLAELTRTGTPAMRSRGKRLLTALRRSR